LKAAAGVVQSPIPAAKQEFQAELAKFFGLTEQELKSLFPELGGVDPAVWAEASAISTASLGAELLSFLDVGKTVGNAENDGLAELADTFIAAAERNAKLRVESPIVTRLAGSLLSKRFLILTGLAGSGKTKLAQALAWWITPEADNDGGAQPCFSVVPVGADWTGNENVLGYPNGLDKETYISKPALDLIIHAGAHEDVPHFLILDEMNMSHVERYFADILSMIESGEELILYSGDLGKPEAWRQTAAAKRVPPKLKHLPENLFIIGTVNVDETTYMFSPKVLDRANVIEFRMDASELAGFLGNPAKPDLAKLDGKGASFGKAFVDAAKNPVAVPADVKAEYDAEMLLFFKTLQAHGAEFGYRTAYETARFTHFYKLLGNHPDGDATWFPGAFDCVVFQKLLPKLHGSRAKLGPVLKKLWFLCVNDAAGRGADALKAAEEAARSTDKKAEPSVVVPAGAPYPLSAEKIGRMWRLLIENGFASFAEA
jgi:5-methylcytosine-specific restriction protein B